VGSLEVRLHLIPELGVIRVVGPLDERERDIGLALPATALRLWSRRCDCVRDLAREGCRHANSGGAEHELTPVNEPMLEIDDCLVPQALAVCETENSLLHATCSFCVRC
jgi:hypothetical protein